MTIARFPALLVLLSVMACSSGGGQGSPEPAAPAPPAAPALSVTSDLKVLHFTWSEVSGADYYRLFEQAAFGSGYVQIVPDLVGVTSYSLSVAVHKKNWASVSYVLQACNSAGCSESSAPLAVLDQVLGTIGYVKAPNQTFQDLFGTAVALSADGNTLAVGAPLEDGSFKWADGGGITPISCDDIDPPNHAGPGPAPGPCRNVGAVYIYARSNTGWELQAYIKAPNAQARDHFGAAVGLSGDGDVLAVGAPGEDGPAESTMQSGAVYVFRRSGDAWDFVPSGYLRATIPLADHDFGGILALNRSGTMLAVGVPLDANLSAADPFTNCPVSNCPSSGSVFVFALQDEEWSQAPRIVRASDADGGERFGYSVAFSGDGAVMAVGAILQANGGFQHGAVYLFDTSSWAETLLATPADVVANDRFGSAIALSYDAQTIAVGADGRDGGDPADPLASADAGAVYVFARSGGVWSEQACLRASNMGADDRFGSAVAVSDDGDLIAVGAPFERSGAVMAAGGEDDDSVFAAGAVYVFTRTHSTWAQTSYVKAPNTDNVVDVGDFTLPTPTADGFGAALALSGDGNILVVGARYEDGARTGVSTVPDVDDNGRHNAGAVYLY